MPKWKEIDMDDFHRPKAQIPTNKAFLHGLVGRLW